MYEIKRNYKDSIFVDLFEHNKEDLLTLMNAILDTDLKDSSDLEIVTIKDSFFVTKFNDLAFICGGILNLYEQQSTFNPNMPLRLLCYVAEEYQNIIENEHRNIYGSKLQKIPTPKFVVFYNGIMNTDDKQILHLSDTFLNTSCQSDLDLSVLMININYGHNKSLMNKCQLLNNYSKFINIVKEKTNGRNDREVAINEAINFCISNDILSEYLQERRSTVLGSLIRGYDQETYDKFMKEEAYEEGRAEGRAEEKQDLLSNLIDNGLLTSEQAAEYGYKQ